MSGFRNPSIWLGEKHALVVHASIDGIAAAIVAIYEGYDGDIYASVDGKIPNDYERVVTVGFRDLARSDLNYYSNDMSSSKLYYMLEILDHTNEAVNEFIEMINSTWERHTNEIDMRYLYSGMLNLDYTVRDLIYSKGEVRDCRYSKYIKCCLDKFDYPHFLLFPEDMIIVEKERAKIEDGYKASLVTLQIRIDMENRKYAVIEVDEFAYITLSMLLDRWKDIQYVVGYTYVNDKSTRLIVKSNMIDCNQFKLFQNDQHAATLAKNVAAQFITDRKTHLI